MKSLKTLEETKALINEGKLLIIAGCENLLSELPSGNWIGGTIPYFMTEKGGEFSQEKLYVTLLPPICRPREIKFYSAKDLETLPKDYPTNGASFVIVPGLSDIHQHFANTIGSIKGIYNRPLVGWVSGVALDEISQTKPKVFSGLKPGAVEHELVVMHVELDDDYFAEIDIINLFSQGSGDEIQFPTTGFTVKEAIINGKKQNFAEYLIKSNIDTKLPMVANYSGSMINTSFQAIDRENQKVHLYAPVFEDVSYRLACSVTSKNENYAEKFKHEFERLNVQPVFACNCILNYLYAELEGKTLGEMYGPVTFGEIAYVLLNQTMVYLKFDLRKSN